MGFCSDSCRFSLLPPVSEQGLGLEKRVDVLWSDWLTECIGEEDLLVKFFGKEYLDYRRRTWVGIPFVG